MMELKTLAAFTGQGINIIDRIIKRKEIQRAIKIHAIRSLQKAINNTEAYLEKSGKTYDINTDLSDLWLNAFEAISPIDMDLAQRLRYKSRFWSNPQKWLQERGSMELVPKLRELNNYCDSVIETI